MKFIYFGGILFFCFTIWMINTDSVVEKFVFGALSYTSFVIIMYGVYAHETKEIENDRTKR